MQYRACGNLGVEVSALGFGAMRLPQLDDGTCDYDRAVPMLRRGLDLGITYIDTAHVYINGTSEVAVGKAARTRGAFAVCGIIVFEFDGWGAWGKLYETSLRPTVENDFASGDELLYRGA